MSLAGEVYAHPCHLQPVFDLYPDKIIQSDLHTFHNTEHIAKHHICLPLYPGMTDDEVEYVVNSLNRSMKEIA